MNSRRRRNRRGGDKPRSSLTPSPRWIPQQAGVPAHFGRGGNSLSPVHVSRVNGLRMDWPRKSAKSAKGTQTVNPTVCGGRIFCDSCAFSRLSRPLTACLPYETEADRPGSWRGTFSRGFALQIQHEWLVESIRSRTGQPLSPPGPLPRGSFPCDRWTFPHKPRLATRGLVPRKAGTWSPDVASARCNCVHRSIPTGYSRYRSS